MSDRFINQFGAVQFVAQVDVAVRIAVIHMHGMTEKNRRRRSFSLLPGKDAQGVENLRHPRSLQKRPAQGLFSAREVPLIYLRKAFFIE